jgi:hypothetical protein
MGQAEISELERIAAMSELIAPVPYYNPNRDKGRFFDFIKRYGSYLNMDVEEKSLGFIEDKKFQLKDVKDYLTKPNIQIGERWIFVALDICELVLTPIMYPLFGSMGLCSTEGETVTIYKPTYQGLYSFFDERPHEYFHAYHWLATIELDDKGLLNIDGYTDIGIMEPGLRVPTQQDLKRFERKFLSRIIAKEKKYFPND